MAEATTKDDIINGVTAQLDALEQDGKLADAVEADLIAADESGALPPEVSEAIDAIGIEPVAEAVASASVAAGEKIEAAVQEGETNAETDGKVEKELQKMSVRMSKLEELLMSRVTGELQSQTKQGYSGLLKSGTFNRFIER